MKDNFFFFIKRYDVIIVALYPKSSKRVKKETACASSKVLVMKPLRMTFLHNRSSIYSFSTSAMSVKLKTRKRSMRVIAGS